VAVLNGFAANLGYPFAAALAHGFSFDGSIAAVRLAAATVAVCRC
jgi:hypothetical protein